MNVEPTVTDRREVIWNVERWKDGNIEILKDGNIEILKDGDIEPKVTDRVDAVSEAGASEMMREVNIERWKY